MLTCAWDGWKSDVHMYAQIMTSGQINSSLQLSTTTDMQDNTQHHTCRALASKLILPHAVSTATMMLS